MAVKLSESAADAHPAPDQRTYDMPHTMTLRSATRSASKAAVVTHEPVPPRERKPVRSAADQKNLLAFKLAEAASGLPYLKAYASDPEMYTNAFNAVVGITTAAVWVILEDGADFLAHDPKYRLGIQRLFHNIAAELRAVCEDDAMKLSQYQALNDVFSIKMREILDRPDCKSACGVRFAKAASGAGV
jgi:hypothetical protein